MKDNKFVEAVELIQQLKGITRKTSERLVVDLINNPEKIRTMSQALNTIDSSLSECLECFYLAVDGNCLVCSDSDRDRNQILVAASILDIRAIEELKIYKGLYAITKGEINLTKGVSPEHLKINNIFQRANENTELILAFNATFNGEVTANYIKELAKKNKVKFSKIARGIPIGGVLDYMDETTLSDSIKNRSKTE